MEMIRFEDGENEELSLLREQLIELIPEIHNFEQFNEKGELLEILLHEVYQCAEKNIKEITAGENLGGVRWKGTVKAYKEIQRSVQGLEKYLDQNIVRLCQNPYLMIHGKGGVGKSHLIAATVDERMRNHHFSILLLGQDFPEDCLIWQRFTHLLKTEPDEDIFLRRLNMLGKENGERILIFLDAINEGGGRALWKNRLAGFVAKLVQYPYIGFVFSIRDEFVEEIISQSLVAKYHITNIAHNGFGEHTMEAVRAYFAHYGIDRSVLAHVPRGFSNGLLLRLFCEGCQGKMAEDIKINTGVIYQNYLDHINVKFAVRYHYSKKCDFINRVLQAFVKLSYGKKLRNKLGRHQAEEMIFALAEKYQIPTGIYDDLMAEGVLTLSVARQEEYVFITYERLADYIFVKSNLQEILKGTKNDGALLEELDQPGILQELAIILPEYGSEIYERFPQVAAKMRTAQAVIESIAWRTEETLDKDKLLVYINNYIMPNRLLREQFYETLVWVSSDDRHVFNARFFHENMMHYTMTERDAYYMPLFLSWNNNHGPIMSLLDWIEMVDNEQVAASVEWRFLCALILSWMMIITDLVLRDQISTTLCKVLRGHIPVLKRVLEMFQKVDDVYVLERLYAVALGVVTYEINADTVQDLAEYVYKNVFASQHVVTDILIRDAAKSIIMYANSLRVNEQLDITRVTGPYGSEFPASLRESEMQNGYLVNDENKSQKDERERCMKLFDVMLNEKMYRINYWEECIYKWYFYNWNALDVSKLMKYAKKNYYSQIQEVKRKNCLQPHELDQLASKYKWQTIYQLSALISDHYLRENRATGELEFNAGAYQPNLRVWDPTINDADFTGKFGVIKPILYDN